MPAETERHQEGVRQQAKGSGEERRDDSMIIYSPFDIFLYISSAEVDNVATLSISINSIIILPNQKHGNAE